MIERLNTDRMAAQIAHTLHGMESQWACPVCKTGVVTKRRGIWKSRLRPEIQVRDARWFECEACHFQDLPRQLHLRINAEKTQQERAEWQNEWIEAYIWWCGDECSCSQPVINYVWPNRHIGFPVTTRRSLWEGTYESEDGDRSMQERELEDAAKRYHIPLDDNHYGRCRTFGALSWVVAPGNGHKGHTVSLDQNG